MHKINTEYRFELWSISLKIIFLFYYILHNYILYILILLNYYIKLKKTSGTIVYF